MIFHRPEGHHFAEDHLSWLGLAAQGGIEWLALIREPNAAIALRADLVLSLVPSNGHDHSHAPGPFLGHGSVRWLFITGLPVSIRLGARSSRSEAHPYFLAGGGPYVASHKSVENTLSWGWAGGFGYAVPIARKTVFFEARVHLLPGAMPDDAETLWVLPLTAGVYF
jgi:hypothetical protein